MVIRYGADPDRRLTNDGNLKLDRLLVVVFDNEKDHVLI